MGLKQKFLDKCKFKCMKQGKAENYSKTINIYILKFINIGMKDSNVYPIF